MKFRMVAASIKALGAGLLLAGSASSFAVVTYLKDYATDFVAYDYNTGVYSTPALGFIGCGPTTGAMILNYIQNQFGATGLMDAGGGLATATTLHGPGDGLGAYMQTGTDGFGSVLRIEPGLEGFAASKGYNLDVMIPVSSVNDPATSTWNTYGAFGSSWNHEGAFYKTDAAGDWYIDDTEFYNYMSAKLLAGIPIFLTVDSDGNGSGDHWVPLVGVGLEGGLGTYWYYDTYDTTLHSASVTYVSEAGAGAWSISLARTITFNGGPGPGGGGGSVPEPGTVALLGLGLLGIGWTRRRRH